MPQAGSLWFTIGADDKATNVLAKANEEFNRYRSNVLNISNDVADSVKNQTNAITTYNKNVQKASGITREFGRSTNSWTRASNSIKTGIKSLDVFGDVLNIVDMATDDIVGKLGGLVVAAGGLATFATASLDVARSTEIAAKRTQWIADALNYGVVNSKEAAAASAEFSKQLDKMSPLMTRNVSELVRMGYQVQWVTKNYSDLNDMALLAGESVEGITRILGTSNLNDLVNLGINTNYAKDLEAQATALRMQQEYFAQNGRYMDKEVALAQARKEVYAQEIEAYRSNMAEAGGTYEYALARFEQTLSKFKNVVGKVYNIAVAPLLGIGEAILDVIASNPLLTYATAIGAVSSALIVVASTALPAVVSGFKKVYDGVASGITAMKSFGEMLDFTKTADLLKQVQALGDITHKDLIVDIALNKVKNKDLASGAVIQGQSVTLSKAELELAEKLRNNTAARIILEKERLGLGKANLSAGFGEALIGKDTVKSMTTSLDGVAKKIKAIDMKEILPKGGFRLKNTISMVKSLPKILMTTVPAIGGVVSMIKLIPPALTAIIPAIGGVAAAALPLLGSIAVAALPVVAAIGAITGAIFLVKKAYESNFAGFADLINEIGSMFKELWGAFIEPFAELFGGDNGIFDTIKEIFGAIEEFLHPIIEELTAFLKFITPALKVVARGFALFIIQPLKGFMPLVRGIIDAIEKIVDYFSGTTTAKDVTNTTSTSAYAKHLQMTATTTPQNAILITPETSTVNTKVGGGGFASYTAARNARMGITTPYADTTRDSYLIGASQSATIGESINGVYASAGGTTNVNVVVDGMKITSNVSANGSAEDISEKVASYLQSPRTVKSISDSLTNDLSRMLSAQM